MVSIRGLLQFFYINGFVFNWCPLVSIQVNRPLSINQLNLFVEDDHEKQLQVYVQKEKYLDNKDVHNLKKRVSTGDSEVTV